MFWLLLACTAGKDSGGADTGADSGEAGEPVEIRFRGAVGASDFACGPTFTGLGVGGGSWEGTDFRMYVHGFRLIDDSGAEVPVALTEDGVWQASGLALLDFEDGSAGCGNGTEQTNARVVGTVPAGSAAGGYTGLAFTLGVPFDLNHADAATAPSPLNLSTMFWGWQAGYKFLRVDGRTAGIPDGALIHLGSTGCAADAGGEVTGCDRPNRAEIRLEGFDPAVGTVAVDLGALLSRVDIDRDGGGAALCMADPSDPECGPILSTLGLNLEGQPADGQIVFRVE